MTGPSAAIPQLTGLTSSTGPGAQASTGGRGHRKRKAARSGPGNDKVSGMCPTPQVLPEPPTAPLVSSRLTPPTPTEAGPAQTVLSPHQVHVPRLDTHSVRGRVPQRSHGGRGVSITLGAVPHSVVKPSIHCPDFSEHWLRFSRHRPVHLSTCYPSIGPSFCPGCI